MKNSSKITIEKAKSGVRSNFPHCAYEGIWALWNHFKDSINRLYLIYKIIHVKIYIKGKCFFVLESAKKLGLIHDLKYEERNKQSKCKKKILLQSITIID